MVPSLAFASEYTVDSSESLSAAWDSALDGDTIQINASFDITSCDWSAKQDDVSITLEGNNMYLWWDRDSTETTLPNNLLLNNINLTGAYGSVLSGTLITTGENVTFATNRASSISVDDNGTAELGKNAIFEDNTSTQGGSAITVGDQACLSITQGATFDNNHSEDFTGGAISLQNNTSARADGLYNLVLSSTSANDTITFTNNTSGAFLNDGTVDFYGIPADVYFGCNTKALIDSSEDGQIDFNTGIYSEDSSASIVKTGMGDTYVADAEFYLGSLDIQEGSVTLKAGSNWGDSSSGGGISIAQGAAFVFGQNSAIKQNVTLAAGAILKVNDGTGYVWGDLKAEGTASISLENDSKLSTSELEFTVKEGDAIELTNTLITKKSIVGQAADASLSDAKLKIATDATIQDMTIAKSEISIESGDSLSLANVTLKNGSTITGGTLAIDGDVNISFDDSASIFITGDDTAILGTSFNNLAITTTEPSFNIYFAMDILKGLQSDGVDTLAFDLLDEVDWAGNITIDFGSLVENPYTQGLVISVNNTVLSDGNSVFTLDSSATSASIVIWNIQNGVVPEPCTTTLGLIALSSLLMRRRRHC